MSADDGARDSKFDTLGTAEIRKHGVRALVAGSLLAWAVFFFDAQAVFSPAATLLYVLAVLPTFASAPGGVTCLCACVASAFPLVAPFFGAHNAGIDQLVERLPALYAIWATAALSYGKRRFSDFVRQIRLEEAWHSTIMRSAKDPLITIDAQGTIRHVNPAVTPVFGYREDQVVGSHIRRILADESCRAILQFLREFAETGQWSTEGVGLEVEARRSDSSLFPAELSVSRVETEDGTPALFTGIVRDITERREIEENLKDAKSAAESAVSTQSAFLANMSHEIRTPMTAILGYSELLEESLEGEDLKSLRAISSEAEHLLTLINDILDHSKIESGMLELELKDVSPFTLIDEVVNLMKVRAQERDIALCMDIMSPLPEHIHTDPLRVRQVLINLLGNAIKFTDEGWVRLRCEWMGDAVAGDLYFEVSDTGIGMTEEGTSRLFRPFTQADVSTTRRFGGTGLGLSISRQLAERLDASLDLIRSAPDEGSEFRFVLRLTLPEGTRLVDSAPETKSDVQKPERTSKEMTPLDGRVLVAEDNRINQVLVKKVLTKFGFSVTLADNGAIALDMAMEARSQGEPFDLIFMDMQMPVMDGFTATRELRGGGYQGPIIALTAGAMDADREKCLAAGCDEFTTKPIDRSILYEVSRRLLLSRG